MAEIVVMGGGLNGLTAGMLLARDGHQVTVLERDAAGPRGRAGDLWQRWDRRGVNQFRQLHFMLPRWRAVMERELPEVITGLEDLGGVRTSMLGALPDEMTGGKRDGDERFETVTGRRPVLEAAVAHAAKRTDGLTVCRGVAVTGLVTGHESTRRRRTAGSSTTPGTSGRRTAPARPPGSGCCSTLRACRSSPCRAIPGPGAWPSSPPPATGNSARSARCPPGKRPWACTNPSLGRGASIGLLHACALRDLLREVGPDEPERLARRFDEVTQATVGPLYRSTLEFDRHRLAEINAEITGQPYQPGVPAWDISKALYAAAACDPDVLRAYTSVAALTAMPADVLAEPGMLDKVISVGSAAPRYSAPAPARAELLAALGG